MRRNNHIQLAAALFLDVAGNFPEPPVLLLPRSRRRAAVDQDVAVSLPLVTKF
jgi:hypothetical protein